MCTPPAMLSAAGVQQRSCGIRAAHLPASTFEPFHLRMTALLQRLLAGRMAIVCINQFHLATAWHCKRERWPDYHYSRGTAAHRATSVLQQTPTHDAVCEKHRNG
jgi:hypothetical protein